MFPTTIVSLPVFLRD